LQGFCVIQFYARIHIISLLKPPLLGHRPSLWITHLENTSLIKCNNDISQNYLLVKKILYRIDIRYNLEYETILKYVSIAPNERVDNLQGVLLNK
jgi:hypothetical protein